MNLRPARDDHALDVLGWRDDPVQAKVKVKAGNTPSRRIFEKVNFIHDGTEDGFDQMVLVPADN